MITGGNVTVLVSDFERAIGFYVDSLGLVLEARFGGEYATVKAGALTIGLHPGSARYPAPGTKGGMMIGIEVDEALEELVPKLAAKGVKFTGPIVKDEVAGAFANFEDPDGAPLYLWKSNWSP